MISNSFCSFEVEASGTCLIMKTFLCVLAMLVSALLEASTSIIVNKEPCNTDKCNPNHRLNGFAPAASKWDFQKLTYPFPLVSAQPIDALDFLTQDLKEGEKDQFRPVLQGLQGSADGTWAFKLAQWDRTLEVTVSDQAPLARFELKTSAFGSFEAPLNKISLQYFVFGDGASMEVASGSQSLINLTKSLKSDWDLWMFDFVGENVMELQVTVKSADKYSFVLINLLEVEVDCSAYAEEGDCEYATTFAPTLPPSTVSTSAPSEPSSTLKPTTEAPPTPTSTAKPTQEPIISTTIHDDCALSRILDSNNESWIQNSMGSLRYFRTSAELASADGVLPGGEDIDLSKLEATGVWLQLPLQSPNEVPIYFQLEDSLGIKSVTVRYFAFGDAKVKIVASQNGGNRVLSSQELVVHKKTVEEESSLWQGASVHFAELGVTEVKIHLEANSHDAALLMDSIIATVPCRSDSDATSTTFVTSVSTEKVSSTTVATSTTTEVSETTTEPTPLPVSTTTGRTSSTAGGGETTGTSTISASTTAVPSTTPCGQFQVLEETAQEGSSWKVDFEDKFEYFETSEDLKKLPGFPESINVTQLGARGLWLLRSPVLDAGSSEVPQFTLKDSNSVIAVTVRYFSYGNASLAIEAVGGRNDSSVDNGGPMDSSIWRQMRMEFENVGEVKVIPSVMSEDSIILIDFISAEVSCTEEVPASSTGVPEEPTRKLVWADMEPISATCRPKRSIDTEADVAASAWFIEAKSTLKYKNHSDDLSKESYFPKEIDIDALDAEGLWMQRSSAITDDALAYFLFKEPNGIANVTVRYFSYGNGSVVIEAFGSKDQKAVEEKMPRDSSPWRYLSMQLDDHVSQIKVIPRVATESSVILIDSITAFANCEPPEATTVSPGEPVTDGSSALSMSISTLSVMVFILFATNFCL